MNDANLSSNDSEFAKVTQALRFTLVALILGVSYANVRCALAISSFQIVYKDMLGNKPLPAETAFVIHAHYVLVLTSFAIPIFAILLLLLRRLTASVYIAGFLILAAFVQLYSTWNALSLPFSAIIEDMEAIQ